MSLRKDCPGCGRTQLTRPFLLESQPVVLNYRFASPAESEAVPRRDIQLVQCRSCGLVFNANFDDSVIPYDANYENRQCFSPAFQNHLQHLATSLNHRYALRGKRILEVGCGKGDFLRGLCKQTGARGVGYDTTFEGDPGSPRSHVEFHRRYVTAADVTKPYHLLICRHVVEHVGPIGAFLKELHALATAAGDPVVVLETPLFEWIVQNHCLWDVFYEHCNYFPRTSLAYLCRNAGFRVVAHRAVFGGQYQVLELRLARRKVALKPPGIPTAGALSKFAKAASVDRRRMLATITRESHEGPWAIWGAGAKGVALVHLLPENPPKFVIDSNAAKQGCVIAGSSVPIIAPTDRRLHSVPAILIANPNYTAEISKSLQELAYTGCTFSFQS